MTSSRPGGALGRWLLFAFLLVALSSVVVLTVAALVGTDLGLATARATEHQQVAARAAECAAAAHAQAGGWDRADLAAVSAIADASGARLIIRDTNGAMVFPGHGKGPGAGGANGDPADPTVIEAPVLVDGHRVGTIRLSFPNEPAGRNVAWSWVFGAAAVALAAAVITSRYVARRLTTPLSALAEAARRFTAGQRDARAPAIGPSELAEVAVAFNGMAEEVVRADRVRRSLAADVAHELRTPLAAVQAGLEELRDGLRAPDTPRLVALHDQALRLGRVVQDLSDLSAAESAAMSMHPCNIDLTDVARAALAAQLPALDAAGLAVRGNLDTALPVYGDPDRLHQVVTNLLANAARYCSPGDQVILRGYVESSSAVLKVADTGPGIPADELPYVFDRLWRGRQARAVAGSGIGLAVVRELVAAHGGSVTATSVDDRGTTVTVRLPLVR